MSRRRQQHHRQPQHEGGMTMAQFLCWVGIIGVIGLVAGAGGGGW